MGDYGSASRGLWLIFVLSSLVVTALVLLLVGCWILWGVSNEHPIPEVGS